MLEELLSRPTPAAVRAVCEEFGRILGKPARFCGKEAPDALLNNAREACRRFGPTQVGVPQMIRWIARWIRAGGSRLDKPTHFESRSGAF